MCVFTFYLDIFIESQEVAKNSTGRPHLPITQPTLGLTSCMTTAPCQNQVIDIGMVTEFIQISPVIHASVRLYVCTAPCTFILCVASTTYNHFHD